MFYLHLDTAPLINILGGVVFCKRFLRLILSAFEIDQATPPSYLHG